MTLDLVIVGSGGFGREAADVVDAINAVTPTWNLVGFVDDSPTEENVARVGRRGSQILGPLGGIGDYAPGAHCVIGVGNPTTRQKLAARAGEAGLVPATLVHPTAVIGANSVIAPGSVICAFVAVGSDVTLGSHVHLDRGSHVGHDSVLEDFVTVHPAAVISGSCHIGTGAELGTNSTLIQEIRVGAHATVGAAACVVHDVPINVTVKGVPAR